MQGNAYSERPLRTGLCKNTVTKKLLTNTFGIFALHIVIITEQNLAENKTAETLKVLFRACDVTVGLISK